MLDDARANEESIYFQQRDRLKVVSPEEEGGEEGGVSGIVGMDKVEGEEIRTLVGVVVLSLMQVWQFFFFTQRRRYTSYCALLWAQICI